MLRRNSIRIDSLCFPATISQEGALWFQNLAEADPYGILPLGFLIPSLIGITVSPWKTYLQDIDAIF